MRVYDVIVFGCWLGFLGVWAVLSIAGGRAGRRQPSWTNRALRVLMAVAVVIAASYADRLPAGMLGHSARGGAVGAVLCLLGLAFGVWARFALGRNWGMPMTLHEAPELVTSGPYAYVRHPIYTAIALMFIGTTLLYPLGVVWCAIMFPYFFYSAYREERDMAQRFPDTYPAYKERSKMFVPFVF